MGHASGRPDRGAGGSPMGRVYRETTPAMVARVTAALDERLGRAPQIPQTPDNLCASRDSFSAPGSPTVRSGVFNTASTSADDNIMAAPELGNHGAPVGLRARAASLRLAELTRQLLGLLGRISGLESTYLTLVDFEQQVQQILYARNTGNLQIPEGLHLDWNDTLCRRVLEGGPACTSEVPELYPDSAMARDLRIQSYVTVPVMDPDGGIFGTLCGASGQRVQVSEDVRLVMETLAQMIALQLANDAALQQIAEQAEQLSAANATLQRLASTDALTGLFNRRHVDRELTGICSFARRRGEPVSVVAIDVDHFKTINDSFGHSTGDDVLVGIAEHLRQQTRQEDLIGRLGGDEFILVLAATDQAGARRLAERVRAAISTAPLDTRVGPVTATVSVGVTTGDGSDPQRLLRRADAALYAAKAAGRNVVATNERGNSMAALDGGVPTRADPGPAVR
jgi:diguanylate cyclase